VDTPLIQTKTYLAIKVRLSNTPQTEFRVSARKMLCFHSCWFLWNFYRSTSVHSRDFSCEVQQNWSGNSSLVEQSFRFVVGLILNKRYQCASGSINRSSCLLTEVKQESQCTHGVTLKRFLATIVAEEKQVLHNPRVCVCSLRYAAYNAQAPYCHLGLSGSTIFFHIIS